METTPLNNQGHNANQTGTTPLTNKKGGKKIDKAAIISAVLSGAMSFAAAKEIYDQEFPDEEPLTEEDIIAGGEPQVNDPKPVVDPEPINIDPDPEPINIDPDPFIYDPDPDPIDIDPDPYIGDPDPEPIIVEPEPYPEPIDDPTVIEDVVGPEDIDPDWDRVFIEEIDPEDIELEDILLVDEVTTIYTEDGGMYDVAIIHDSVGQYAMIDITGDHVYDVIVDEDFNYLMDVNHDIDVSDAEQMYAQQHGETDYLAPSDIDLALYENTDTSEMMDDINLV